MNTQLIVEAMNEKHLSPEQLATACAVSRPTIERILDGRTSNPGIMTMSDICINLGLSLDEIMDIPAAHRPAGGASAPGQSAELSNLYRAVIHVKDSWIKRLAAACAVLVGCNMFYWLIDFANTSTGWVTSQSGAIANVCRILIVVTLVGGVIAAIVISARREKSRRIP